jgi:TolB-like protein/Tfp pilus assembly protein PilF
VKAPLRALVERARRRNLPGWVLGYLAAAWLALEVVDTLGGMWAWPSAVGRVAFVLLAAGLPATAVLAWYHGEAGTQRLSATEAMLLAAFAVAGVGGAMVVLQAQDGHSTAGAAPPGVGSTVSAARAGGVSSLVVLPFTDLSPGRDRAYLGDGIAETLINSLARVQGLRVVARTSAFQFRGGHLDVREIARRLGVATVLEGSVAQVDDRIRITANLTEAGSGLALWADRFDREVSSSDLFSLQDEVARRIVDALQVELAPVRPIVSGGSTDPAAQRAYFMGLHRWTRRTTEDMAAAARWFHEAIAADSTYADAWAGLALAYALHTPSEYDVPGITAEEALNRTEAAAFRALELDSTLAAAHVALGEADRQRGSTDAAEARFRRAIELNPGYATAHHWLAGVFMERLEGEAALEEISIAESLDPVAPAIMAEKAEALMMVQQYDAATAQMDRAVELHPTSPVLRNWGFGFAVLLDQWDRAARHMGALLRQQGHEERAVERITTALRAPDQRMSLLRSLAEGTVATGWGLPGADSLEVLTDPAAMRFVAMRKVFGDSAAISYMEEVSRGPNAGRVYVPVMPALMGPELAGSDRGRRLMERLRRRSTE